MFDYDYTFCAHEECDDTTCFRHHSHIPLNTPISLAELYGTPDCQRFGNVETLAELTNRIQVLKPSDGDILWCSYDESKLDGDTAVDLYKYISDAVGDEVRVLFVPDTISISVVGECSARVFAHKILSMLGDE